MEKREKPEINEEIEFVFAGTGTEVEDVGKCDDECVGGRANTKAMEKTVP